MPRPYSRAGLPNRATAAALNPVIRPASEVVTIGVRSASSSSRRCASRKASVRGARVAGVAPGGASADARSASDGVRPEPATNPPTGAGSSGTFGLLVTYSSDRGQLEVRLCWRSDHTTFREFTQIHMVPQPFPGAGRVTFVGAHGRLQAWGRALCALWRRSKSRVTSKRSNTARPSTVVRARSARERATRRPVLARGRRHAIGNLVSWDPRCQTWRTAGCPEAQPPGREHG